MKRDSSSNIILATMVDGDRHTERKELSEILVGKDMLELVSSAMYSDPMTVYREYIQNAADAVDAARKSGLLSSDENGRVDITFDMATRTVKIRDNGCGLPFSEFGRNLTALGGSKKRGTSARGFRGVGRLAGLAYTQKLVFRSRVPGESFVSELVWDCRLLKSMLRQASYDASVVEIIRAVTTLERVQIEDVPERFFEVELRSIVRLKDDRLMSPSSISEYLSQVAPVPFSPKFQMGTEISRALSQYLDLGELDIRVNDSDDPIYRPHLDNMNMKSKLSLVFESIEIVEIPCVDEGISAVAWIAHHEYAGAVPSEALLKGFRLRTGNIQVGGHAILEDLFIETRFNSWTVGEVHIIDKRIVPNGRRDQFEDNIHFSNLINHLTPTARDISRRCRTNSKRRRLEREFELRKISAEESIDILIQGSTDKENRRKLAQSIDKILLQMSVIADKELLAGTRDTFHTNIQLLQEKLRGAMNEESIAKSPLMRLPEAKRKSYEHFFGLVYECSTNRSAAKALIDRMLLKIY